MSYIDKLRKSKEKAQVAFQEFALSTSKFPEHLFCFFEGKDNAYYVPRIKRYTAKYHVIACGGREKVLDVYRLITNRNEYAKYKKAFFIDRDFNEPLLSKSPPIFETPCYSIENLYVSVDVFKEILSNEFHLSESTDESFIIILNLFTERQNEFHKAICLLNSWYACLIEIRNSTNSSINVSLDDKLPRGFIDINLNSIKSNYDIGKIKQFFPGAPEVNNTSLDSKLADFNNCIQHKVFRGKYEMQFLLKFIHLLLQDSISKKVFVKNKINFAFGDGSSLNNEQAINIFEGYAETPESLNEYLIIVANKNK